MLTVTGDVKALSDNRAITVFIDNEDNILFDVVPDPQETEVKPLADSEDEFDWLDWTWCQDCEDEPPVFFAAAPLAKPEFPVIQGCPVEMEAVSLELGIPRETIQISIANSLALNPNIQPCQACASLIEAANILRDPDGSKMAAMNQIFNELAPSDAPFTPEMADSIVSAFADHAGDGTQYALVSEYIDAFVKYISILDTGLGAPVGDSAIFVMLKHGTGITNGENTNVSAFIASRLENMETFGI